MPLRLSLGSQEFMSSYPAFGSVMAPEAEHTYGLECRLAPPPRPEATGRFEGIPPLRAHFFYSAPVPIDDPLSTTVIAGAADSKSSKLLLRPFSLGDSNALEKTWLGFASDEARINHCLAQQSRGPKPTLSEANAAKLDVIIQNLAEKHKQKHGQALIPEPKTADVHPGSTLVVCCPELLTDVATELQREFCALERERQRNLDRDGVIQSVMAKLQSPESDSEISTATHGPSASGHDTPSKGPQSFELQIHGAETNNHTVSKAPGDRGTSELGSAAAITKAIPIRPPPLDDGISGKPFLRVTRDNTPQPSPPASLPRTSTLKDGLSPARLQREDANLSKSQLQAVSKALTEEIKTEPKKAPVSRPRSESRKSLETSADIVVGVSRLHMVSLPILQMKPIYWSPINDISAVMRATWFYK
jgi:hypothetical protein